MDNEITSIKMILSHADNHANFLTQRGILITVDCHQLDASGIIQSPLMTIDIAMSESKHHI